MATIRKHTAKDLTLAYLKEKGIAATRTKVGVNFNYDGWNFLLWHDADDSMFFRLTLPGIFDVTDENYAQALLACNTLNWNYKVVKASLYEYEEAGRRCASVWVCFEQIIDDLSSPEIVPRAISVLIEAAERFQTLLEK